MAKHIVTFRKGLDKDTNVNSYSNESYPHAENLRILSNKEQGSGTLTAIKDSTKVIKSTYSRLIVGEVTIGDNLVVFTKNLNEITQGTIWVIPLDVVDGSEIDLTYSGYDLVTKVFNFGDDFEIVARYESEDIQKLYWVDGKNPLRFINIKESKNSLSSRNVDTFNIVHSVKLTSPVLEAMIGGTLRTGVYQYAYCLFNLNGSETAYSPATNPIPISTSSLSEGNSGNFKGSPSGELSPHGVSIKLENLDTSFTHVRLVRLYYSTQEGVPEIEIVYEGNTLQNMSIHDFGGLTLGTLTLEDYRDIPNLFIASTLESKKDYLFAGNTKEEYFDVDFDMRAYRFATYDSSGETITRARVWNGIPAAGGSWWSDVSHKNINSNNPNWDVPEEYTVNPYNIYGIYHGAEFGLKYQIDGRTLGGTGPNISYKFTTSTRPLDDSGNSLKSYTDNYQDLSNPIVIDTSLGFQRGDIYRFGVVFYDKYGRQSFVKWIGDIRIPDEEDNKKLCFLTDTDKLRDIFVEFRLKGDVYSYLHFSEEGKDIVGWQIVRAERTYQDACIKDCGYSLVLDNQGNWTQGFKGSFAYNTGTISGSLREYLSPETVYNKNNNVNYRHALHIEMFSKPSTSFYTITGYPWDYSTTLVNKFKLNSYVVEYGLGDTFRTEIRQTELFKADKRKLNRGLKINPGDKINNKLEFNDNNFSVHGTCLLLRLNISHPRLTYTRRISEVLPYNGYSLNAIQNTRYYACSPITNYSVMTTTGDCYIGIFEYNRGLASKDTSVIGTGNNRSTKMGAEIVYLPVETKINLKYASNDKFSNLTLGNSIDIGGLVSGSHSDLDRRKGFSDNLVFNAMWETKGVHEGATAGETTHYFEQDFDLYTYNPVYSVMNKSKVFLMKPKDLQDTTIFNTRIRRTYKKINGELSDTWTKFPINNYIDVDTKYKELIKLLTFENNLFFFQKEGIGVLPIEEREVVSTEAGNLTTIGVGGVLDRYDYISTESGISHKNNVVVSSNTIYFADTFNRSLSRISEGVEPLSDLKGLKSLVNIDLKETSTLYNSPFKEIWFNIPGKGVYAFNEYTDAFASKINESFKRGLYTDSKVMTFEDHNIKLLNSSKYYKPWKLDLIINPNNLVVNRFDSITFGSINLDNTSSLPFTKIELLNRYQNSGVTILSPTNMRRRFRNWIFNSIRDLSRERFYDSYMKIKLSGTSNLEMHDVIVEYSAINTL